MTQRWVLPAPALGELATLCGVELPVSFRPPVSIVDDGPAAQAELLAAHAVAADGTPAPLLAAALRALAEPLFTVEVTLAPTRAGAEPDPTEPARAWTALVAADAEVLAVLLRRDLLPLVEVGVTAPAQLPRELHRLLDTLPEPAAADRVDRPALVPLDLIPLMTQARGAAPDVVARVEQVSDEQVEAVRRLIETADATLDLRVVGAGAPPLVDQLLWYLMPTGWISLEAAPDEPGVRMVRLQPVAAADAVAALAPLIDAVLPTTAVST